MPFKNQMTFRGHAGAIYAIEYDGRFIYSASADKYVVRWNVSTQQQDQFAIKLPSVPFFILLIDHNTKLVVGLSNGNVHVFDLIERSEIKFFQLHHKGVFSGTENMVENQFYLADGNGTFSVWDCNSLKMLLQLPFNCGKIRKIELSNDKQLLYLCCQDGKIRVLDSKSFNLVREWDAHVNGAGAIVELDDHVLVSAGKDAYLRLWDRFSLQNLKKIPAHNYMIYSLIKLNPTQIASASRDKTIKIWDTLTWNILQRLDIKHSGGHQHSVNQIIKINENTFASASDDAQIIVWERHHAV